MYYGCQNVSQACTVVADNAVDEFIKNLKCIYCYPLLLDQRLPFEQGSNINGIQHPCTDPQIHSFLFSVIVEEKETRQLDSNNN